VRLAALGAFGQTRRPKRVMRTALARLRPGMSHPNNHS